MKDVIQAGLLEKSKTEALKVRESLAGRFAELIAESALQRKGLRLKRAKREELANKLRSGCDLFLLNLQVTHRADWSAAWRTKARECGDCNKFAIPVCKTSIH